MILNVKNKKFLLKLLVLIKDLVYQSYNISNLKLSKLSNKKVLNIMLKIVAPKENISTLVISSFD